MKKTTDPTHIATKGKKNDICKKNKSMSYFLFSRKMKLADLILTNYKLLYILPRFNINLGFGEKCVDEICRTRRITESLFLLVCNVYTFDDYLPCIDELKTVPVNELTTYLSTSHTDYMTRRIPDLEKRVLLLVKRCNSHQGTAMKRFFTEYKQELLNHFDYEEQVVFPYIEQLQLHPGKPSDFSIDQFEKNHTNIEEKLTDLKNIIIKYLPENCPVEQQNETLLDLFFLEDDINKHTRIENKILIPLVTQLEYARK